MKILLLEDDQGWANKIQTEVKGRLPRASFTHFDSEWGFRNFLRSNATLVFDVAIFDIMVRWASYREVMEKDAMNSVPQEVLEELEGNKRWRAGIRCRSLMEQYATNHAIHGPKCLFFSVLMPADVFQDLPDLNGDSPLFVKSDGMKALVDQVWTAGRV